MRKFRVRWFKCPFCGSEEIVTFKNAKLTGGYLVVKECKKCRRKWVEE